ncbi:GntR family transcriptional regulator [Saccharopolyspora hattusasensis]|uniref:GntR family transcriptional regulator n=1 Tax=Saccharopolyspora hattusasensis TaxID=1128679 RepID=UPI003D988285
MDRLPEELTKSERLAVVVRDAILSGELAPGRLYSAQELGERFGVSRTPVREALLKLANVGLVRIERNRGARILTSTDKDINEVFTLRLLLEPPAAARAAGQPAFPVAELDAALAQMTAQQDDREAFFAADRAFHDVILRASGNERLAEFVAGLRDAISLQGRRTIPGARSPAEILAEHEEIAAAIRAGDRELTARTMHEHLLNTAELLIATHRTELREWLSLEQP